MLMLFAALLLSGPLPKEVDLARSALAQELGVAPGALKLRWSRPARWSDGSLGCPRKGESYPQVVTKGREVVLESGGRDYAVHVASGRAVICQTTRTEDEAPLGGGALVTLIARKDLAARLQIDPGSIETNFVRPFTWPDASLGCPEPGMSYAQMETKGFLIELKAKDKTYTYHSDMKRAVPCDK
jgi:hypothetical protein